MRLGIHIRVGKGLQDGLAQAKKLGCETVQFFSSNPNSWRTGSLDKDSSLAYKTSAAELDIYPTVLHTPYLVNLASPNPDYWQKSIDLLVFALMRADLLGAEYVVTHIGSHKGTSYQEGVERICLAVKTILEQANSNSMLLLEAGSGSGDTIGSKFNELADIFACMPTDLPPVGVTLDTAHMYAAGYDIDSAEKVDAVVKDFDQQLGISRLKLLHLNDTKQLLDSKVDRHWHIGQGLVGLSGFDAVINHPSLKNLAAIAETPGTEFEQDLQNLESLKALRKE